MPFNTEIFLFAFLPLTLAAYYLLRRHVSHHAALGAVILASFVYYGWWNLAYVPLLAVSLAFNFVMGRALVGGGRPGVLAFGIAVNLGVLCVFKYADFLVGNVAAIAGADWALLDIALPIGISFITFQKIAFLVDVHRGVTNPRNPFSYTLFVVFFPQLVAGPIVHHREIAGQFDDAARKDSISTNLSIGLSIFALGLAKKVLLADSFATIASPGFSGAAHGLELGFGDAWIVALAYTLQIFFDFSGYSDMAVGLARMFGYHLPVNFNAPYRSTSIVEFWRRWHITLSRFLRDYLYVPLGGNRKGTGRRYLNLMIVMLLGGLWHGAAWTFVIWGGLHGLYLVVNHLWRAWRGRREPQSMPATIAGGALTFLVVVIAWVFFRAASFEAAISMLQSMAGLHGFAWNTLDASVVWVLCGLGVVWLLPDTPVIFRNVLLPQFLAEANVEPPRRGTIVPLTWRPHVAWAVVSAVLLVLVFANLQKTSEFIYFEF